MFLQLGALCLLILGSLRVNFALPPCVCNKDVKPVCGSDGQTYDNECQLHCAQVTNKELILEKNGRCNGTSLGPPRVVRQIDDCDCPSDYYPVCTNDHITYPSPCSLECFYKVPLSEIAYIGECRPRSINKRETVRLAELPSNCSCPRTFAPVCGSDDITYENKCALDCVSQIKPELRHKYSGMCEKDAQSCSCSNITSPVCGTDGNTYENACYLNCTKEINKNLDVLHIGACDSSIEVATHECTGCTLKVRPVCGTDGKTYRNPCMLNCVREGDEDLHIDYEGACDRRLRIVHSSACADCMLGLNPVCGSDGKTYRNHCWLNCSRTSDETLMEYAGFCLRTHMDEVVEEGENFPCSCTRNDKPVCASNGATFGNQCLMECAGAHLTVAKAGPCDA